MTESLGCFLSLIVLSPHFAPVHIGRKQKFLREFFLFLVYKPLPSVLVDRGLFSKLGTRLMAAAEDTLTNI